MIGDDDVICGDIAVMSADFVSSAKKITIDTYHRNQYYTAMLVERPSSNAECSAIIKTIVGHSEI